MQFFLKGMKEAALNLLLGAHSDVSQESGCTSKKQAIFIKASITVRYSGNALFVLY